MAVASALAAKLERACLPSSLPRRRPAHASPEILKQPLLHVLLLRLLLLHFLVKPLFVLVDGAQLRELVARIGSRSQLLVQLHLVVGPLR